MKKNNKMYLGIVIITVIIMSARSDEYQLNEGPKLPSELIGTWERAYQSSYTNTLIFTYDTLKDSSQRSYWRLINVSGDAYKFVNSNNPNLRFTNIFKIDGNILEISGNKTGSGENDWDGSWKKSFNNF